MVDMTADAPQPRPHRPRAFGKLPAADTELNGDYMQVLYRLAAYDRRTRRFLEWYRRIGDAYLAGGSARQPRRARLAWGFLPRHRDQRLRLRDHGNEALVGLVLLYHPRELPPGTPRAARYQPVIRRMLDRILESANPDGLLYSEVNGQTLEPTNKCSPTTGLVYAAPSTPTTQASGAR